MCKLLKFLSRRKAPSPGQPPEQSYSLASDGTKILHYQELHVEEVLPPDMPHRRIFDDWERIGRPFLEKLSYCPLELLTFVSLHFQKYKLSAKEQALLSSPIPRVDTDEDVRILISEWFDLFNSWFFANSLGNTALAVEKENDYGESFGYYLYSTDTITIAAHERVLMTGFPGSIGELHINTLLHEMVHAFTSQYSCLSYCCEIYTHPSRGGGMGFHGPVWADITAYLRAVLRQTVNWPVDANVASSVQGSMCIENWQPTKKQLVSWEIDPNVWGHIDKWDDLRKRTLANEKKQSLT